MTLLILILIALSTLATFFSWARLWSGDFLGWLLLKSCADSLGDLLSAIADAANG